MTLVDEDIAADERLTDPARSPRRPWRWVAATAGAAAVLTAAVAITTASGRDGGSTILKPRAEPSRPSTTVPLAAVNDVIPEPAAAPVPERLSESSRLRLDGIGPVLVGMTLDEASAAAGMPLRIVPNSDRAGTGSCAYVRPEGGPTGLSFMVLDGRKIARIDVGGDSAISTLSGIRTGSTEAEVHATYPDRINAQPNPYSGHRGGRDLVYQPDEGSRHLGLLFQTDGGRVVSFRAGIHGAVMAPEGCA